MEGKGRMKTRREGRWREGGRKDEMEEGGGGKGRKGWKQGRG